MVVEQAGYDYEVGDRVGACLHRHRIGSTPHELAAAISSCFLREASVVDETETVLNYLRASAQRRTVELQQQFQSGA